MKKKKLKFYICNAEQCGAKSSVIVNLGGMVWKQMEHVLERSLKKKIN